jgi:predicted flap endonuclease-1-like 5' DNA nuclease
LPGAPGSGPLRSAPPPPPSAPSAPPLSTGAHVAASPSVVPRAPATPPPPPQRSSYPPSITPVTARPSLNPSAQLEQRFGAAQIELRKLGSERHTLRARLRREGDRVRELESALRAEQELRKQAADEHYAALSGLRARLSDVEAEKERELARLGAEVAQLQAALERVTLAAEASATVAPAKVALGLRRIRGIGPAYQRSLEQLGVTRVEQLAAWTDADVVAFAEKLKVRVDRIVKDDWVGQAKSLPSDPED